MELFSQTRRLTRHMVCVVVLALPQVTFGGDFLGRPEVDAFIQEAAAEHGLTPVYIREALASAEQQVATLIAIEPPKTPAQKSWQAYRDRFVTDRRVSQGLDFMELHRKTLERAAHEYGVPTEIITAIIGIETVYGRNMGRYRVIDTLATLAFDYPPRSTYFRAELGRFLRLSHQNGESPTTPKGSYAGAIGIPQFMPGSILAYAADFDQDGKIDLRNSPEDAIGSVARFLAEHGWVKGGRIVSPAVIDGDPQALIAAGIKPTLDAETLAAHGVGTPSRLTAGEKVTFVDLATPDAATEYWLGFDNFYVITRYNRSSFYAMSVTQLAEALEAAQRARHVKR